MSKQDRQGVRTATDLEQKYNFGQSFAEVMGIARDAQTAANKAAEEAGNANNKLTPDEIFNLLTNNGQNKGIYKDENGEIYINASYIRSGELVSADGKIKIYLNSGDMPVFNTGISTNGLNVRADEVGAENLFDVNIEQLEDGRKYLAVRGRNAENNLLFSFVESFVDIGGKYGASNGVALRLRSADQLDQNIVDVVATNTSSYARFGEKVILGIGADRKGVLGGIDLLNGLNIEWVDNGDGTYSLVGRK